MAVIIRYQHPLRPNEAGMTRVPNGSDVATVRDRLERCGFQIIKIMLAPPPWRR
jgi:hypothetical protein